MSNIVTYSDFTGEINLSASNAEMQAPITAAITRYEREFLALLLGDKLADAMIADYTGGSPSQEALDLFNGVTAFDITISSKAVTRKWAGLKTGKAIAYYIYYKYRLENESRMSGVGQTVFKAENADRADFTEKLVTIWNKLVQLVGETPDGSVEELSLPTVHYNFDASAYNFLLVNVADYGDWLFTPFQYQNRFGL